MFDIVPTGFIPDQDNDSLFVNLQAAQGTSYYDMAKWTQQVADIVIQNPYVDSFLASVGGDLAAAVAAAGPTAAASSCS